jgi:hypothetical protein
MIFSRFWPTCIPNPSPLLSGVAWCVRKRFGSGGFPGILNADAPRLMGAALVAEHPGGIMLVASRAPMRAYLGACIIEAEGANFALLNAGASAYMCTPSM